MQVKQWNMAAMIKHLWKVHSNKDDLWVHWIKCRLKGQSIWFIDVPNDCAWSQGKILGLRDLAKRHMVIKLRDGRQASLFFYTWCGDCRLAERVPDHVAWGSNLIVSQWRCEGIWQISNSFGRRCPQIAVEINSMDVMMDEDKPLWSHNTNGKFSISNCYYHVASGS